MIKTAIVIQTSYSFYLNKTLMLKTAVMKHGIFAFQNNNKGSSEKYFIIHFFVKTDMALIFIIMSPAAANMLKHLSQFFCIFKKLLFLCISPVKIIPIFTGI